MKIELPSSLHNIMKRLKAEGHQVYAVGGALRDQWLGRPVTDWDVATSAKPEIIHRLFPDAIPTGVAHGTYTVRHEGDHYEVTTFRVDGPYQDGRHPTHVEFVKDINADLSRRDFTINALAYDPWAADPAAWIDPFAGRSDLKGKLIRTVGDPDQRFTEDGLRLIRAARFAAQLDFVIESNTYRSMAKLAHLIGRISSERIRAELMRTLSTRGAANGIELLHQTGLLREVIPELSAKPKLISAAVTALKIWSGSEGWRPQGELIAWALLCAQLPPATTGLIMKRLKFSNHEIDTVAKWLAALPLALQLADKNFAQQRILTHLSSDQAADFIDFATIVLTSSQPQKQLLPAQQRWLAQLSELLRSSHIWRTAELAVDGNDVMGLLGLTPGPQIRKYLDKLLELTWQDAKLNQREILIQWMVEEWRDYYRT